MDSASSQSDPIVIIDHGVGNISSVVNMLRWLNIESVLSREPAVVGQARRLILPGVGAFDAAMSSLKEGELDEAVRAAVSQGSYLLGICLGFQLLLEESEEGKLRGLEIVEGVVRRLRGAEMGLRIPHMGWNVVHPVDGSKLFRTDLGRQRFYFAHSYYAELAHEADIAAVCDYGGEFCCALESGRVMGVQFHPEKSHRFGMALLEKFAHLSC